MSGKEVVRFPANAIPNRVIVQGQNIYYGNKGESKHGHTVVVNGEIQYSRTREGRRLK